MRLRREFPLRCEVFIWLPSSYRNGYLANHSRSIINSDFQILSISNDFIYSQNNSLGKYPIYTHYNVLPDPETVLIGMARDPVPDAETQRLGIRYRTPRHFHMHLGSDTERGEI